MDATTQMGGLLTPEFAHFIVPREIEGLETLFFGLGAEPLNYRAIRKGHLLLLNISQATLYFNLQIPP